MKRFLLSLFLLASAAWLVLPLAAQEDATPTRKSKTPAKTPNGNSAKGETGDVAGLPRVLLIGDSISIGYTPPTQGLLKGKVNLHRIRTPANGGPTTRGLANLSAWLGEQKWDVIHFNWGLHDLKYMGPNGENRADPSKPDSRQQVPPAEYEKNLRELVKRLKATGAKLIWASTTPVPEGAAGRIHDDSIKYNEIAQKIMEDNGVAINDLHALALLQLEKIQRPKDVHFTPGGSKILARQVANCILKALGMPELPKLEPAPDEPEGRPAEAASASPRPPEYAQAP